MWILSGPQESPLRKAGASLKTGTSADGFRITPRRIPPEEEGNDDTVLATMMKDRRPRGRIKVQEAILS
jgi:hypothetical protein